MARSPSSRSYAFSSSALTESSDGNVSPQRRPAIDAAQHLAVMVAGFDAAVHDRKRSKLLANILRRASKSTQHLDNLRNSAACRDEAFDGPFMGRVSQRTYDEIFESRVYDLYGRRVQESEEAETATVMTGVVSTRARTLASKHCDRDKPVPYIPVLAEKPVKIQALQSSERFIGFKPIYNPPPGFAASKGIISNSEGLHIYYSYDGAWKDGKMHGDGVYKFADLHQYDGKWESNFQHGYGKTDYANGGKYQGSWRGGYFQGNGVLHQESGVIYTGSFFKGKRHGHGKLELPCGVVYEGAFEDDHPHGRGVVTSKQSGYRFEGTFVGGHIEGSGVLITPKGERIVRYWPNLGTGWGLTTVIRVLDQEQDSNFMMQVHGQAVVGSKITTRAFERYLKKVQEDITNTRATQEREAIERMKKAMLDRRMRLQQLKFKAIDAENDDADDDDDNLST